MRRIIFFLGIVAIVGIGIYFNFARSSRHPNVILIMIDTLRGNHLGAYQYPRNTSPNLDAFAKENLMFSRAIAVAPWTPPSVASILTGLSVAKHKYNPNLSANKALKSGQRLSSKLKTLPEILNEFGYRSAGVSSNPWISESFGFTQGMRPFYYVNHAKTDVVMDQARKAVEELQSTNNSPFFLYVHIIDPHGPYQAPAKYAQLFTDQLQGLWPYPEKLQKRLARYDREIRFDDDEIGKFFDFLRATKLYDDAVIVVVSDHGEQFSERGFTGHGHMLHIEELHVPLLVKCRGKRGIVYDTVSNLDVTPTILDCLDLTSAQKFDGISVIDQNQVKSRPAVFSSLNRRQLQEAITTIDGKRLILSKGDVEQLADNWNVLGAYSLNSDPWEQNPNLEKGEIDQLRRLLETERNKQVPADLQENDETAISKDVMDQLKSLGYIGK